jgi:hypothetical protein
MVYNTQNHLGLDFVQSVRYCKNYKTQRFGNWICFRPQVSGRRYLQLLKLALSKGPNGAGVFSPSPEDGNRFSFRNVAFPDF